MASLTVGLYGPLLWAVALAGWRLLFKSRTMPSPFGRLVQSHIIASSFSEIMAIRIITIAGCGLYPVAPAKVGLIIVASSSGTNGMTAQPLIIIVGGLGMQSDCLLNLPAYGGWALPKPLFISFFINIFFIENMNSLF